MKKKQQINPKILEIDIFLKPTNELVFLTNPAVVINGINSINTKGSIKVLRNDNFIGRYWTKCSSYNFSSNIVKCFNKSLRNHHHHHHQSG